MNLKVNLLIKELDAKETLSAFIKSMDEKEASKFASQALSIKHDKNLDKIIIDKKLFNLNWLLASED